MQKNTHPVITSFLAICFWIAATIVGNAGDFADREIIGFTDDGSLFAFEEYGVQDGSGFPYSNIYIIDTATDRWVSGSPFRARIENENAVLADARNQSRQMAGTALHQFTQPGFIAATNTHTEIQPDPYRLVAAPRSYVPSGADNIELRLQVYDVQGEDYCSPGGTVKAFKLVQTSGRPGFTTRALHDDGQDIPASRNCALDYGFADLVTYYPDRANLGENLVAAVLIRYRQLGFEGPDGRYIAVTFRGG